MNKPPGYEKKFAEFIQQCSEANASGIKEVTVGSPSVLGSNYEELMESLSRLAVAGLSLHIATHRARDIHRNDETGSDYIIFGTTISTKTNLAAVLKFGCRGKGWHDCCLPASERSDLVG